MIEEAIARKMNFAEAGSIHRMDQQTITYSCQIIKTLLKVLHCLPAHSESHCMIDRGVPKESQHDLLNSFVPWFRLALCFSHSIRREHLLHLPTSNNSSRFLSVGKFRFWSVMDDC
jgi:hypothetical protein